MGQTPTKDNSPVSMATEDYFNIRQKKKVGHTSNAEEYSIPSKVIFFMIIVQLTFSSSRNSNKY